MSYNKNSPMDELNKRWAESVQNEKGVVELTPDLIASIERNQLDDDQKGRDFSFFISSQFRNVGNRFGDVSFHLVEQGKLDLLNDKFKGQLLDKLRQCDKVIADMIKAATD